MPLIMSQASPPVQIKSRANRVMLHDDEGSSLLQREVADRLFERLDYIRLNPEVILDLGARRGYSTERLEQRYPAAQVLALDPAEYLGVRSESSRSQIICAAWEALPLRAQSVDLIYSNLSLQHLPDPGFCLQELQRILKPGGLLLLTSLGPDSLKELRTSFLSIDAHPRLSSFIDMHHLGDALLASGWQDPVMDMEMITLSYSSVRDIVQDIRANTLFHRHTQQGLMSPRAWRRMEKAYARFKLENQQLPATAEIIYAHAWKEPLSALGKLNEQGEVCVSVEAIPVRV